MDVKTLHNVGFVGLGAMGKPMAMNLAQKLPHTCKLHVFDVVKERGLDLAAQFPGNVTACDNSADVASKSVWEGIADCIFNQRLTSQEIVFTMLPEGEHVKSVFLKGASALISTDLAFKVFIDCSTIDIESSTLIKKDLQQKFPETSFYDAPVSGGVRGAELGTLVFFLGCHEADPKLDFLTNLLQLMGRSVIPCGGSFLGLASKTCNNYALGIINIANAEAMNLGIRSGISPKTLYQILTSGSAQNLIWAKNNPEPGMAPEAASTNGYKAGFKSSLMAKDMQLATKLAQQVQARLLLGDRAVTAYSDLCANSEWRDLDFSVIYRFLQDFGV